MNQMKDKVARCLETYKLARDDDWYLIFKIWSEEANKCLSDSEYQEVRRALNLLYKMRQRGTLTAAETITRCRRKAQEENPDLRGEKYLERQTEQQEMFKETFKRAY